MGPLLTLAAAGVIVLLWRYVTNAPIAAPIFLWAIVLSAYYGGLYSGLASSLIAVTFAVFHLSEAGHPFTFNDVNFARLLVLAIVGPAIAATVGLLHVREKRALRTERKARGAGRDAEPRNCSRCAPRSIRSTTASCCSTATCAPSSSIRAFRRMWDLPDAKADGKPTFVDLLYHGRDTSAYAVAQEELDKYVAQRSRFVQRGDETPVDLRLSGGEVLRFKCKPLPSGGRMLSYASVTDLVKQAEELQKLATTDPLTGLHNRRLFFSLGESEWTRFERHRRPLSILMIDIDHFKTINDRFGHDVGDKVIARVAAVCRAAKRDADIVARIGGEEFAILLPETKLQEAVLFGDRLRHAMAEKTLRPQAASEGHDQYRRRRPAIRSTASPS